MESMQKVLADNTGKYFKSLSSHPTDITIERFEVSVAFDAITAHEDYPTLEDFEENIDPTYLLGRPVCPLEDKYPGRVEETRNLRGKELTREERRVYVVKYYLNTVQGNIKISSHRIFVHLTNGARSARR